MAKAKGPEAAHWGRLKGYGLALYPQHKEVAPTKEFIFFN